MSIFERRENFAKHLNKYAALSDRLYAFVSGHAVPDFTSDTCVHYGYDGHSPMQTRGDFAVDVLLSALHAWGGGALLPSKQVSSFLCFLNDTQHEFFLSQALLTRRVGEPYPPISFMIAKVNPSILRLVSTCCLIAAAGEEKPDYPQNVLFPILGKRDMGVRLRQVYDALYKNEVARLPSYLQVATERMKENENCIWKNPDLYQSDFIAALSTDSAFLRFKYKKGQAKDELSLVREETQSHSLSIGAYAKSKSKWKNPILCDQSRDRKTPMRGKVIPLFP